MDGESYPMQDRSRQVHGGHMPEAPPNYEVHDPHPAGGNIQPRVMAYSNARVQQPAEGNIQPHVITYNNVHVQQPSGHTVVVIPSQAIAGYYINDYIFISIFSCLCCFWPVGIVAIVMSCMVCSSRRAGDFEEARSFSKWARYLSLVAIMIGVIIIVIITVMYAALISSLSEIEL